MKEFRIRVLSMAVAVMLTSCNNSPQKAKEGFMHNLIGLVHQTEQKSIHFTSDKDWNSYDMRFHDLVDLDYLEHAEYMEPAEHRQVEALKERYYAAQRRYTKRRITERLEKWTEAMQDFWKTTKR